MSLRRRSRELTLQMLFQMEFGLKTNQDEMIRRFAEDFGLEENVLDYAQALINGIFNNREAIDGEIQKSSAHWKVPRMALVDLNVMRIAVFEMKMMDPLVPPKVCINEAVEIAKKYGSTDSGSFVNGILDQIAKGIV
jgi:N utilization substance protein B